MNIRIAYAGRGYHGAGSIPPSLELPDDATLDDAISALNEAVDGNGDLQESCLVSLSGRHVGTLAEHESPALRDGDEVMLIAPVAGG